MEELGSNGIKIYTFPNEQPVGELNAKMNVSNCVLETQGIKNYPRHYNKYTFVWNFETVFKSIANVLNVCPLYSWWLGHIIMNIPLPPFYLMVTVILSSCFTFNCSLPSYWC